MAQGFRLSASVCGSLVALPLRSCSLTKSPNFWARLAHVTQGPAPAHGSAEVPLNARVSAFLRQLLGRLLPQFQSFFCAKLGAHGLTVAAVLAKLPTQVPEDNGLSPPSLAINQRSRRLPPKPLQIPVFLRW